MKYKIVGMLLYIPYLIGAASEPVSFDAHKAEKVQAYVVQQKLMQARSHLDQLKREYFKEYESLCKQFANPKKIPFSPPVLALLKKIPGALTAADKLESAMQAALEEHVKVIDQLRPPVPPRIVKNNKDAAISKNVPPVAPPLPPRSEISAHGRRRSGLTYSSAEPPLPDDSVT